MKTRFFLSLLPFLLLSFYGNTQGRHFPQDWLGHWSGTLHWYQAGETEPKKVPMQLKILPGDGTGYGWQLAYGEKDTDNRPYMLVARDSARGHWVIDELNGIVLDQFLAGGRLTGAFTVMKNTILNSYCLQGDSLLVEFHTFSAEPFQSSGLGTEESPKIMSYRVTGYQRAVLRRNP